MTKIDVKENKTQLMLEMQHDVFHGLNTWVSKHERRAGSPPLMLKTRNIDYQNGALYFGDSYRFITLWVQNQEV